MNNRNHPQQLASFPTDSIKEDPARYHSVYREVVINTCYGGFSLSESAMRYYAEQVGSHMQDVLFFNICRDDPALVQTVRLFGAKANGIHANLKIVCIPMDVKWHIAEYDGREWVAEDHRTWS